MNWRHIAVGTVAVAGLLGVGLGAALYGTFGGDARLVDGAVVGTATTLAEHGFVAAYGIDSGDGGVILVDSLQDPAAARILAWLGERGLGPADVRAILVTHGHGDHVGGCAMFPKARVVALAAEKGLVEGTESARGPLTRMSRNDGSCRVDHLASDGETLTIGTKNVTAFAIPGHTVGSTAWLVDGVLFLGDAASSSTSGEVTAPKWIFSDDQDQGMRSLVALAARLDSAGVQWLAFSHAAPLKGLEPLARVRAP